MLLVGWEPLPSLRTLRARAAYANASREQAAPSTDVIVGEPSPSLGILQQPEKQSVDLKTAASSSNLLHKEEAFSPSCALADAARSGLTRPENLHQPAEMLRQQPQHKPGLSTELDQESQEPALEEGELPEGEEQLSGSGPDERVEDTLHNQQSAAEVTESAAAPAAKRKRGERAGKRVRQRQAKRAREMELGILPDEARHKQVPKRLTGKKRLPTCKYYLFGKCSKGSQCPFPHTGMPVTRYISCRFFQQGECGKGDDCQYSHDDKLEPCKQLVLHGVCRFGPACRFSHDPLPGDAVAPLQEWFKEQDQMKQERSGKHAADQLISAITPSQQHSHLDTCYDQMIDDDEDMMVTPDDGPQDTCTANDEQPVSTDGGPFSSQRTDDVSIPQNGDVGPACYHSWDDGWRKMYAGRLKLEKLTQATPPDPATFAPLSGPYKDWNDGWKHVFANSSIMPAAQDHDS